MENDREFNPLVLKKGYKICITGQMKITKGAFNKMISLNAKTLLEELLEFKETVENTDKHAPQTTDCKERTEQCIKDLVYRLQRYQNS